MEKWEPGAGAGAEVRVGAADATGRHSLMLEKAIDAARDAGLLPAQDEAMLSVARAAAFALDAAEAMAKPSYAISHLLVPYTQALNELRLTPSSRVESVSDPFEGLLNGVTEAT